MKHRLNLDIKDPNYTLLKKIFIDSRKIFKNFSIRWIKKFK